MFWTDNSLYGKPEAQASPDIDIAWESGLPNKEFSIQYVSCWGA